MRIHFVFILTSLLAVPATAADLRPITHEDVWLMKRLSTPVVSPDGRQAVVSVSVPSYEEDGATSDLWLVDVSGDMPPRQLTTTKEAESDVDWSPDGSRIAFSTKRGDDEVNQIYFLNMVGPGEAFPITGLSTGAGKPKWSPDGDRIAFESRVYPGAANDEENAAEKKAREERDYNVSVYEMFPIRQWDNWRDDLKTHIFVQDAEVGAEATDLLAGTELVDAAGYRGVESTSGDSLAAVWTPDGSALVISATTELDRAAHARVRRHLYEVPLDGTVRQLTASDDWSCTNALFSDDGSALFCQVRPANEHVYNQTEIGRFDWRDGGISGRPDIITETFDRPITGMDVSDNGRTVYATAYDAGRSRVYAIPARGGDAELLDEDGRGAYAGVKVAGRQLVARWESSATPAEIVRIGANGEHVAITAFNAEHAAQLDRKAFLEFWFESSKGRRIHSWLALPPDFDESKKYPLVLLIHGGPFATTLDADHVRWSPHIVAAPGYVVLMTDYTGSVGYGQQFSRNIQGDPLKTPGEELVEAADAAIERYPFIDCGTAGRSRRELRRAPGQLAAGIDHAFRCIGRSRGTDGPGRPVLVERYDLRSRDHERRPCLGRQSGVAGAEPVDLRGSIPDADPADHRREGLPRADQSDDRSVVLRPAHAGPGQATRVPRRQSLDHERCRGPLLLAGSARLAGRAPLPIERRQLSTPSARRTRRSRPACPDCGSNRRPATGRPARTSGSRRSLR